VSVDLSASVVEVVREAETALLHKPFRVDALARKVREVLDLGAGATVCPTAAG
jgi:hypothetical protein